MQAEFCGLKTRVRNQVRAFYRAADIVEELVIKRGDLNVPAVLTPEGSIGRIKRAGVPDPGLDVLAEKELADLGRLDVDESVHQAQLNLLTNTLLLAGPQADHGGKGNQIGAGGVGDSWPGLQGFSVPLSGDAHKAGQCLSQGVNARSSAIRAVLAKGADRDADDFLVIPTRFFVRHPQLGFSLGAEVVDNDIGRSNQPEIQGFALRLGQVQHQAAFIAVNPDVQAAVILDPGTNGTGLIPIGRLNFNHVRTHIAQHGRAVRTGQHTGDIQNANPLQRQCHGCLLLVLLLRAQTLAHRTRNAKGMGPAWRKG